MIKHLIDGDEFGPDFVKNVLDDAILFKNNNTIIPQLSGKILSLLFFNKSLRTRFSFLSGISKLGATAISENIDSIYGLEYGDNVIMNDKNPEHIKDMMSVLSRYSDIICLRDSLLSKSENICLREMKNNIYDDTNIKNIASYSKKPIINMESDAAHPMQGFADAMTMIEKLGSLKNKKICLTWVPHVKKLPIATPQSQLLMPAILGADVVLACPKDCILSDRYINKYKNHANSFKITHIQDEGIQDADVVIAKSWSSIENNELDPYSDEMKRWILNAKKMELTNKDSGYFTHCMPIRRNVEVDDDVIDGSKSIMLDVAENRMWVQMAVINLMLK